MTMPDERTRSVLVAREFLVRLSSPYVEQGIKGIKKEVREEVRRILRHFPNAADIYMAGKGCPQVFDHGTAERWMSE